MSPSNASLPTRQIGSHRVSALGYGTMGLAGAYGTMHPDEQRLALLDELHARGVTFWDSAWRYGDSEVLLGKWFARSGKRDDIFLATKFGLSTDPQRPVNGTPEFMREQVTDSLSRLGVDTIDLYYLQRPDPKTPIEVSVGAMAELVKEGKVKYLGLSEVSASCLRRAHAVHPIAAIQVEYSPFTLDIEDPKIDLLRTARELGITVVAYSPLGRGLLTGRFKSPDDFGPNDPRRMFPRFSAENFPNILKVIDVMRDIGARHQATVGQVSLAWVLAQGSDVVPIASTTSLDNLKENIAALDVTLTADEVAEIRDVVDKAGATKGDRYPAAFMSMLYAETPALDTWKA